VRAGLLQHRDAARLRHLKRKGFSDTRLASLLGITEEALRRMRYAFAIHPVYKRVDTCAAEFATSTAYLYSTYEEECEAEPTAREKIVVLGGGTYFSAPEYGADTVKAQVLVRLRYAAHLHRALGKPVLASGGAPEGNAVPEAQLMRQVLQQDFQVPVQWIEPGSNNTFENALKCAALLKPAGVQRIYLVTHAWHLRRARVAFEHAGFEVIPAPTGFAMRFRLTAIDFLPDARALHDSGLFFREVAGIGWYYVRSFIDRWRGG